MRQIESIWLDDDELEIESGEFREDSDDTRGYDFLVRLQRPDLLEAAHSQLVSEVAIELEDGTKKTLTKPQAIKLIAPNKYYDVGFDENGG
jgi:hypothetical protein